MQNNANEMILLFGYRP